MRPARHHHSNMLRFLLVLLPAVALFALGSPASAQSREAKRKAEQYYKRGLTEYNLGNFPAAIGFYKKGYIELPDPAFLFNIAQAYRQIPDCKNALFFYRRYLSSDKNPPQRAQVEERVKELDRSCKELDDIIPKPPNGPSVPKTGKHDAPPSQSGNRLAGSGSKPASGDPSEYDDGDLGTVRRGQRYEPRILSTRISAGAAYIPTKLGNGSVPVQFSFAAGLGYPIRFGPIDFDFGAMLTITPVPWENGANTSVTSVLTGVLANVGAGYAFNRKLSVRGEFGVGALIISGLKTGNVFTDDGKASDGPVTLLNLRMGASIDYAITENLILNLSPITFSYSPSIDILRDEISSLTRFDFMAGIGYRI